MKLTRRTSLEYVISILVFTLLLIYSYALVFEIPYVGFDFDPGDGRVIEVFAIAEGSQVLLPEDRLIRVGSVNWEEYHGSLVRPLFENVHPGSVVPLRIQRDNQEIRLDWVIPNPSLIEVADRIGTIWVPYIFWLAGTGILFLVRPKDLRWKLLVAFNYLTAIWLTAGWASFGAIWNSALTMRVVIWLSLPVYLHLHWVFPKSLGRLYSPFLWGLYLASIGLAALQWFQLVSNTAYFYGFILAVFGSAILLFGHAIVQPDQRSDLRLFGFAVLMIILPTITIGVLASSLMKTPVWFGWGILLSLPAIPGAYFFTIYRRQLGGLELRANRIISLYIFSVIFIAFSIPLVAWFNIAIEYPGIRTFVEVILLTVASVSIAASYPRFQYWIEHRVLGMPLPPTQLVAAYASRIATSLDKAHLTQLLRDEILPSLFVRQSALLLVEGNDSFLPLYKEAITDAHLPVKSDIPILMEQDGKYLPFPLVSDRSVNLDWVRLLFSLKVESNLIGFWLLGRRDPDDLYASHEISALQTISHQVGIALTNIAQAEELRALYQADVERHENERVNLARDLHDDVLNQFALLSMNRGDQTASLTYQDIHNKLTSRIRQIISGLRPAMLTYGLSTALDELADVLADRAGGSMKIELDLQPSKIRFAPKVEEHIYRIIQQICDNALRHSEAKVIRIQGRLEPDLKLVVEDDGIGFPKEMVLNFNELLSQKHFGLAGIQERTALIGADIHIESIPGRGTKVILSYCSEKDVRDA